MDIGGNQLQRYLDMRRQVDPELRLLHSLSDLLACLEHIPPERAQLDPVTIGIVNATMAQSALNVRRALDEFLLTRTAEGALTDQRHNPE